ALSASFSVRAQSASKIIDRYKKATGGDAVKKIKNTVITGSVKMGEGAARLSGSFSQQTALPDRLRTDIQAGEFKSSECYNGKSAWRMDARGLRTLIGAEAKRLRLDALLANSRLRDISKLRIYPQSFVKANVNGSEAFAIEF